MIVKKLAVPFINEKLLQQAQHCYIATAAISEAGFDFVRTRMPLTCKIEMVTGLDTLTSPQVLRRVWRNYQDRMMLNIYTKNTFHANVYIFDLPFRKAVAFVGSGTFSLEGIKDHEEIFYKITDPKEIEGLKSWFTGYFEFGMPVTEDLIAEYELLYPAMKQREIASRQDKQRLIALTASGFHWDSIKFKNQFFKKEDYLILANANTSLNTDAIQAERLKVQQKLLQLHELIKDQVCSLKFNESADASFVMSSVDVSQHSDHKINSLWVAYGKSEPELQRRGTTETLLDFLNVRISIRQNDITVALVSDQKTGKTVREYFQDKMQDASYRNTFFKTLAALDPGCWIEVAGERKTVVSLQTEDAVWEFIKADDWRYFALLIEKNYYAGDNAISLEQISSTLTRTFAKLVQVCHVMESQSIH
jgi:hypothetical protein